MRRLLTTLAAGLLLFLSAPAAKAQAPTTLKGDLLKSVNEIEQKMLGLATALSEAQYDWRPGEGVRSIREVLLHVAADNYFLPAAMGVPAPAATKITATDYAAVQAFEGQKLERDAIAKELQASFDHLEKAVEGVPDAKMDEKIQVFGQEFTTRGLLVITVTHLHEHLGQMIAYARMNGVKPPWSR